MKKLFEVIDGNDIVFCSLTVVLALYLCFILLIFLKRKTSALICSDCFAETNFLTWSLFGEKSICQDCANKECEEAGIENQKKKVRWG